MERRSPLVICIDDDPLILKLLSECLEKDFDMIGFENQKALLEEPRLPLADAFVLDIRLNSSSNGIVLSKRISLRNPWAPFLFISGFPAPRKAIAELPKQHVTDFIEKPFSVEALINRLWIMMLAAGTVRNMSPALPDKENLRMIWKVMLRVYEQKIESYRQLIGKADK
ncbi:MAG: response regulator [Proteobacteria bacterium]|nr:response regulator [Pseudomonadota bacterium]